MQMQCHDENNGNGVRKSSILPGNAVTGQMAISGTGSNVSGSNVHGPLQNTVFIHKLYNILEDDDLKDLIWWSPSGTSFLIRPTEKFSRALATYFKHTNIASFVRQLNMYGFHKVSNDHGKDLQQQLQPSSEPSGEGIKIWEFRHSLGIFRRGDIEGLKLIKRRSSRNITTLGGRKNSTSTISVSSAFPQAEEPDIVKQQRPPHQASGPQAPQQPQWPQSQYIVNAEEDPQQPQVGLTAYPSSESVYNQQFQQQQLESRYAELSQSYSGLRYEYTNLQYRHDGLLEKLRILNVDVAKLLEFVQNLVTLQSANCDLFNESNLKGDPNKLQQFRLHLGEMAALEQEMNKFKSTLVHRFQKNLEILQQQPPHNSSLPQQQQPHMVPYGPNVLHGHATPSISKDMRPLSRSSIPANPPAAAAFAPHVFSVPSAPPGATFQQPGPGPFISPADNFSGPRMVMMNPFETTGHASTGKRNMSILMDPLSSAPNVSGVTGSPSRPLPVSIGSQIPRNPSPLVNSSKPPKQEPAPQNNENNQPTQASASAKRSSRISLKDGTFLLKPNKSNTLGTKRTSINSDSSSRSDSAAVSGSGPTAPPIESGGPKDASAIGLPFRTFYSQGTNGEQPKEESAKNENLPSRSALNVTLQNSGGFAPLRNSQASPRLFEPRKPDLEAPETSDSVQHTILSPIPSRSDLQNRRASSGVYSLLNTESASPRSSTEPETNPKKKTKL